VGGVPGGPPTSPLLPRTDSITLGALRHGEATAPRRNAFVGPEVIQDVLGGNKRRKTEGGRKMPQEAWSAKRERQYKHIKGNLKEQGASEDKAEEIAARTVNKERARKGEARQSSRLSRTDISSGRRGGLRSGTSRPKGRTKEQLYNEAKRMGIEGRSRMTKAQLQRAVDRRK
jgi:hypothetical protein